MIDALGIAGIIKFITGKTFARMDALEKVRYERLDYAYTQLGIRADPGDTGFLAALAEGDGDAQLAVQIIVALPAGPDGLVLDEGERGESAGTPTTASSLPGIQESTSRASVPVRRLRAWPER